MKDYFIPFRTRIEGIGIPTHLNNPFGKEIPEIAKIAAIELQDYIAEREVLWRHNFGFDDSTLQGVKGKMFGVLVVQNSKQERGYISTFSGKLLDAIEEHSFVPSVFDPAVDDFFINHGMRALADISSEIKALTLENTSDSNARISELKEKRKNKSHQLQQQLFANYHFTNLMGSTQNLLEIFAAISNKGPAAGTGECAAPKLLEFAIQNGLTPIAIAEFWWGRSPKKITREHKAFYPACQNKCRHLLEYMLGDRSLFDAAQLLS